MSNGKERAAAILRGPEGDEIYHRLARYAEVRARMYGWRTGMALPGSASPRSIAHEVVAKILSGVRTWDEETEPSLLNALKGMARSEIGHLYEKLEDSLVEPINTTGPDCDERTADSFSSARLHPEELNPEEQLLQLERSNQGIAAMTLVLREVEGDEDLESVFLALCDTDDPSEIAEMTGLPIKRVYSARRQLDRIVRRIPPARVIRAARDEYKS